MADQGAEVGSEEPTGEAAATGSSGADGVNSEAVNGEAAPAVDDGSAFLAEIARAMQSAAGAEHIRIAEDTERRRQAQVDQIRARQAAESDRMRELAGEDKKAIDRWADGETARIQRERERRTTELNADLETSLSEHRSRIDLEIEGVETAIATYRADVEVFFERLDRETDPLLIAQQAARRPVFPTLVAAAETPVLPSADVRDPEAATAEAEGAPAEAPVAAESASAEAPAAGPDDGSEGADTASATDPALVGVMDPQAPAEAAESWAAPETSPEPVPAGALDDADQRGEALEAVEPVTAASAPGSLLQSIPVHRPMGWLRRDSSGGDSSNGER